MARVAVITCINGSTLTNTSLNRNTGLGGTAYLLRGPQGEKWGTFSTVGSAQQHLKLSLGKRKIVWRRCDLPGKIENWVGYDD